MNVVGKHNGGCNIEGHFSFNSGGCLAQAFYVVGFCKDGPAVEGDQGEKDCPAGSVGASTIGHLGVGEDTVIAGLEGGQCPERLGLKEL